MLRVAINGYGRIGRCVLRALYESGYRDRLQLVAINEPADADTVLHLTRYDSTHGRFPGQAELRGEWLHINGDAIRLSHQTDIQQLDWSGAGVDLVLECSGSFSDRATAECHLQQGAQYLLFSQPADADVDLTLVYGVNHEDLTPAHRILSNASCTTNALVPVLDCLDRAFGIECGHVTTIHSAMNDQPVLDAYHHNDLRRTRSAFQSIIPVKTELARGVERILPKMAGRLGATAMRVPTLNVSAIELTVELKSPVSAERVNQRLAEAAQTGYGGVLGYTDELLASCDFNHDPHSAVVDGGQTCVVQERLVKVMIWFDNEWGFASRMLDVARLLAVQNSKIL